MLQETWGLLAGERLSTARRTRTLGLGAAVREFNERAVPGLGGVWFGKQVLLAMLGIVVAERAKQAGTQLRNIEVANAIEALACWLAFKGNSWAPDPRLRGINKLHARGDGFSFSKARQRNFYVTQPMRMSTVQALPSLGFAAAEGVRFNSFSSTALGREFVAAACDSYRPFNRNLVDHLVKWVTAGNEQVPIETWQMTQALAPTEPLPGLASKVLAEGLHRDDSMRSRRRSRVLSWVDVLRVEKPERMQWFQRPNGIEHDHWHDLEAGASFFAVRDASIRVLDAMEAAMANKTGKCSFDVEREALPAIVLERLDVLLDEASRYLAMGHAQAEAAMFCKECLRKDRDALRALINRDGAVLRLMGSEVRPAAAFSHAAVLAEDPEDDVTAPKLSGIALPKGMSYRVGNLYLLNLDMKGQLQGWLDADVQARSA